MNAVYILCVKNHINCTEERSRKDGEFTTAPEQRLPGTMPQEGRCPCLFQAAKKFEQLNRMLKCEAMLCYSLSTRMAHSSPHVKDSARLQPGFVVSTPLARCFLRAKKSYFSKEYRNFIPFRFRNGMSFSLCRRPTTIPG